VFNHATCPNLVRLFADLQLPVAESEMSCSVQVPAAGLEWSGCRLDTVFAQRLSLVKPRFLGMLRSLLHFNCLTTAIARPTMPPHSPHSICAGMSMAICWFAAASPTAAARRRSVSRWR